MEKIIILYIAVGLLVLNSCNKESVLKPSEGDESIYSEYLLPQGDNDFDDYIVEFYEMYGTLILYKFREKEYSWNVNKDIKYGYNPVNGRWNGYLAEPAMEEYVGYQLELIRNKFLKYFPEDFLIKGLPLRILLTKEFNYVTDQPESVTLHNAYLGYDYLAFSWGNEKILTMTQEEVNNFKVQACALFFNRLTQKEIIEYSILFTTVTNYSQVMTNTTKYRYGVVYNVTGYPEIEKDWNGYIEAIISHTYEELISEGGILHPDIDVNGLIRQKYDYITDHFMTKYNINLQEIGNEK